VKVEKSYRITTSSYSSFSSFFFFFSSFNSIYSFKNKCWAIERMIFQ